VSEFGRDLSDHPAQSEAIGTRLASPAHRINDLAAGANGVPVFDRLSGGSRPPRRVDHTSSTMAHE
jgi:hypothetical protein